MSKLEQTIKDMGLTDVLAVRGGHWEWTEFSAWRSPTGRFYWYTDGGCSCHWFAMYFIGPADFKDDTIEDLERAFTTWCGEQRYGWITVDQWLGGIQKLRELRSL